MYLKVENLVASIRTLEDKCDRYAADLQELKKGQQAIFKALRGIMCKLTVVTDPHVGEDLPDIATLVI